MRYAESAEFIDHLPKKAGLNSPVEAGEAWKAALATPAERLTPAERENLAARLPKELKPLFPRAKGYATLHARRVL